MTDKPLVLVVAVLALCACRSQTGLAGTYRATSGLQQIILNDDGTFREMYGERTSAADISGTYTRVGNRIVFLSPAKGTVPASQDKPAMDALIRGNGFTIGQQTFEKE